MYLLCWKTWEFHQDFSFIDRHVSVGSSSFFPFIRKTVFTKSRKRKKIHAVYVIYGSIQFSSLPGDNVVWGGLLKLHCILTVV